MIFDHLPKTAGMAVTSWLTSALGSQAVTANLMGDHADLIRRYGGEYSVIAAHMDFAEGERLDPRYQYLTCFRDPIDRAVSWIFYVLNDTPLTPDTAEKIKGARLFLESEGREATPDFYFHISNVYVGHFCRIGHSGLPVGDAQIAAAMDAIRQYHVVGVYERMTEFIHDVADVFGIVRPPELVKANVTTSRPKVEQVSAALRERLTELNELDIELYRRVLALKSEAAPAERPVSTPVQWDRWDRPEHGRERTTPHLVLGAVAMRGDATVERGRTVTFDLDVLLTHAMRELIAGIRIVDDSGRLAFGTNTRMLGAAHRDLAAGSYRVTHLAAADLMPGRYRAGFAFTEDTADGPREIAWFDHLCEFEVRQDEPLKSVGYADLPAAQSCMPTPLADDANIVLAPQGRIELAEAAAPSMHPGEAATLTIRLVNEGSQAWRGDVFRPIRLSYHWLDSEGVPVVFDGERTALAAPIPPRSERVQEMTVIAPAVEGALTLELTIVQEMIGWFELLGPGFISAKRAVKIARQEQQVLNLGDIT